MDATMTGNAAIVLSGYQAFVRGDVPALFALFDEEIEWTLPGPRQLAGTYVGHEGVARFFERLATAWEQELRVDEAVELDRDRVLVLGTHVVEGADGAFEARFAHLWRMRDGRALSFYEYTDTERFATAFRG
ncbi:MAG TPA: nuclear transport factor 2 family protein [Gaiellaceae bacterium]|nr:nuclear transport factor 2 family protein [Gaiellaceae bacterium]